MTTLVLHAHALATLAMLGLIWFVQIVHYPLFARVGESGFAAYEAAHQRRTTLIVAPLMLTELATAATIALAPLVAPQSAIARVPHSLGVVGLALVLLAWASTALVQVPLHRALGAGFDAPRAARLVRSNWMRTAIWTVRAPIALAMLAPTGMLSGG